MADTKIEWADRVWNPISGCTPISEGCQHCFAERMSKRLAGRYGYPKDNPFQVTLHPDKLSEPDKWKGIWKKNLPKPSRIFVCSMGDLFHDDVPYKFLFKVFDVIYMSQFGKYHTPIEPSTFMVLTKRPGNAKKFIDYALPRYGDKPFPNLWLGVTAENQARADERIPILLQIPAAVRFVSIEPCLGPVDLTDIGEGLNPLATISVDPGPHGEGVQYPVKPQLDWVIVGGETGPGARPMHPDWARLLRDQCQAVGVPFFFKSWGDWQNGSAYDTNAKHLTVLNNGETIEPRNTLSVTQRDNWQYLRPCIMSRVGKKSAGRLLGGAEYSEYPGVKA